MIVRSIRHVNTRYLSKLLRTLVVTSVEATSNNCAFLDDIFGFQIDGVGQT